jgi:hypothetical protein
MRATEVTAKGVAAVGLLSASPWAAGRIWLQFEQRLTVQLEPLTAVVFDG